ncbi:hypothetical protein [Tenacibaculum sp. IB213877]|uniref:hypothetical protein n=1 Tax=Tenacibaculum sp. IB213877 TaxID=3097351 RepID=UPI002A59DDDC|nr:hypothetical protein [Tenacibaculum sp. IB213877]
MKKEAALLAFDSLHLQKPEDANITYEQLVKILSEELNELIQSDFNKVLNILYRIDVDEHKISKALATNPENRSAGIILAELIIERQLQKIYYRKHFNK